MQSSFDRSLSAVLRSEGGWSDHPADNGGATNKGITIANFRRFIKADGTKADLRALTTEQAAVVYRHEYWDKVSGAVLPAGVDHAVFDMAVNSGPSRAIKFLQRVVGVKQDGRIGPITLAAVATKPPAEIVTELMDARLAWLKTLGDWSVFGKGWASRVANVRKLSLALAAEASNLPAEPPVTVPAPDTPATPETPAPEQPGWQVDWTRVGIAVGIAVAATVLIIGLIF